MISFVSTHCHYAIDNICLYELHYLISSHARGWLQHDDDADSRMPPIFIAADDATFHDEQIAADRSIP